MKEERTLQKYMKKEKNDSAKECNNVKTKERKREKSNIGEV